MYKYMEFYEHIEKLKKDENYIQYFRNFAIKNMMSDFKYVKEVLEYVLELTRKWKYKFAEHWCLTYIGWCENCANDFLKASTTHLIANDFFEKEQCIEGIIVSCNALLSDYLNLGELELAIRNGMRGIELATEEKDEKNLVSLLLNTAETYVESENYDEALDLVERLKNDNYNLAPESEVVILSVLSKCALYNGDYNEAYEYCNTALTIMNEINYVIDREEFMGTRALINYQVGNIEEAIKEFEEIIKITSENDDSFYKIKTAIRWAKCYFNLKQYELAKEKLFIAINDENLASYIKFRVQAYELLKNIYSNMGDFEKAYKAFEKYDEYKKEANTNHSDLYLSILRYKSAAKEAKTYKSLYEKMDLISTVGRKITASLGMKQLVRLIYNEIGKVVAADVVGVGLYNKEKNRLVYETFIEKGEEVEYKELSLDNKASLGVYSFLTKKEVVINDIVNEYWKYVDILPLDIERIDKYPASIIYLPILLEDKPIAVLTVQSNAKNVYASSDIFALRILASYIAIAIENGKLFDEVNYFANNDVLTKILNRNKIIRQGEELVRNRAKTNSKLSIIMMDVDYFKKINDTYGHYVGDIVLKGIAKISKKQIKDIGFVGRYGGEEFLILLPKLDLENAKKIAELIRETVEKSEYEIKDGIYGKVTVSLGVYEFGESDQLLIDGLKKADMALYKAKGMGRNISVSFDECKESDGN